MQHTVVPKPYRHAKYMHLPVIAQKRKKEDTFTRTQQKSPQTFYNRSAVQHLKCTHNKRFILYYSTNNKYADHCPQLFVFHIEQEKINEQRWGNQKIRHVIANGRDTKTYSSRYKKLYMSC